jgi:hypothetical protein
MSLPDDAMNLAIGLRTVRGRCNLDCNSAKIPSAPDNLVAD